MGDRREIVIPERYINKYGKDNINMWSFSKISSYSDGCQWEYYLSRILKKQGISNSYGVLGGICHEVLEDFYNGKIKYEDMKEIFETKWLECEMLGIKLYGDEAKNTKMMAEYKQDILNFFETHQVSEGKKISESEIWIDLEHGGDICIGYIDSILKENGKYIIEDYKTSTLYKGNDIYAHQKQLLLYTLGLNQLGIPLDQIAIRWNFLKYTNVTFTHMINVSYVEKDKPKTSCCLKSEWVSKVKTQLKKDIVEYYANQGQVFATKELKAMIDKCVEDNSLESLPKAIQDMYVLEDVVKTVRRHKWAKESPIQTQIRKDLKMAGIDTIEQEMLLVECADSNSLEPVKDIINIDNYVLSDAYVYGVVNEETVADVKKSLCDNVEIIKSKGKDEKCWEREEPIGEQESFYCSILCSQRRNCKYYQKYKEDKERYEASGKIEVSGSNDELLEELMNL